MMSHQIETIKKGMEIFFLITSWNSGVEMCINQKEKFIVGAQKLIWTGRKIELANLKINV